MKTIKVLGIFLFLISITWSQCSSVSANQDSNGIVLTDKNFKVTITDLYSDGVYFSWSYPTGLEGSTYVKLVEGKKTFGALRTKEKAMGFSTLKPSTTYTAYFTYINDKGSSTAYKLSLTTKKAGNEEIFHPYMDLKGTINKNGVSLSWKNDTRIDSYIINRNDEIIGKVPGNSSSFTDQNYLISGNTEYIVEAYVDGKINSNDFYLFIADQDAPDYVIKQKGTDVTFGIDLNIHITEYHVYINQQHFVTKFSKDHRSYNLYEIKGKQEQEQLLGSYKVSDHTVNVPVNHLLPYTNYQYEIEFLQNTNSKATYLYPKLTGEITTTNDVIDHWASSAITKLMEMEIMSGYQNGLFMPNSPITRAEFAKAFLGTAKIEPTSHKQEHAFKDVTSGSWYEPYILSALQHQLIVESEFFKPNEYITRQEIAVMVNRLLRLDSNTDETLDTFSDKDTIAPWASHAMSAMIKANIMSGDQNGKLNPAAYATRAEVAAILVKVINAIDNA